jgi:hypothetical protein
MAILPDGTGPGRSVIVALWALAVVWALSTHPVWKVAIWVFSTLVLWVVFWWGYPRAS